MDKKNVVACIMVLAVFFVGCGQDLPFEYHYRSARLVEIRYMDQSYLLNRYGPRTSTPFGYEFESDGDLDITIAGQTYDIDSPYDIDSSKKTRKVKKKKKKTTTKKSSKRNK